MPHNARFLYQQPKIEINNYLIVNWFSLPLQFVKKHLVLLMKYNFLPYERKEEKRFCCAGCSEVSVQGGAVGHAFS